MTRLRARLSRLETQRRANPPDPHALCLELFQTRIVASGQRERWELDAVLPEKRPLDPGIYPQLECFVGPAESCPHQEWADDSYRRDLHLRELASLDLTDGDWGAEGPEPEPETLERQRQGVAAYRSRYAAELPKLEQKLNRMKEGTRHV